MAELSNANATDAVPVHNPESVTGIRIAVSMRRSEDGPTEEIELVVDELDETESGSELQIPPLAEDDAPQRQRMPPLPPRPPRLPLAALRASSATAPAPLADDLTELLRLRAEIDRLARKLREREAHVSEVEKVLAQRSQELLETDAREAALAGRVHEQAQRIAALEQQLQERNAPATQLPAAAVQPAALDASDLLKIRGIGPRFARALHAAGVESCAIIAAWSAQDVLAIAARLNIKPARIQRDGWVEQARTLLALPPTESARS